MKWQETVLQDKDFAEMEVKTTLIEDGKSDFIIKFPMTEILERQAKRSFLAGINEYHALIMSLHSDPDEARQALDTKMLEWGVSFKESNP